MNYILVSSNESEVYYPASIKALIAQHADLTIKDKYGKTALMYARSLGFANYLALFP
jgi:hypothetical protein